MSDAGTAATTGDAGTAGRGGPGGPVGPSGPADPGAGTDPRGATAPDAVRRRRRGRVVALLVVVLVVLLLAAGAWVARQALTAADALRDARGDVRDLQAAVEGRDVAAARTAVDALQASAARATGARDGVWRAAEHLPWAGRQLAAVGTVATALDDVAARALPPALDAVDALTQARRPGTTRLVDPQVLADVAPGLRAGADVAAAASGRVSALAPDGLVGPVAEGVDAAAPGLATLAASLGSAADVLDLLPGLLGADGPRTYLVASVNPAELRAGGGIVGAVRALGVDGGALRVGDQLSTVDLRRTPEPVLELTEEEVAVLGTGLGTFVQNATATPDFPRTAALVAARWQVARPDDTVDGVVAADPVALAALLEATGPLPLPDGGTLAAADVTRLLLRDAYRRFPDGSGSDGYFAEVTATVLSAVAGGAGTGEDLARAVWRAVADGHLKVWSADAQEQTALVGTAAGGAFLSGGPDERAAAGVFLEDTTGGKLDYYLRADVSVEDLRCDAAEPTATVRVDLAYDPGEDVASLPPYVVGPPGDRDPTTALLTVRAYAPVGAALPAVEVDGATTSGTPLTHAGREVQAVGLSFAPGERHTVRFFVPLAAASTGGGPAVSSSSGGADRAGGAGGADETVAAPLALQVWSTPTLTGDRTSGATCPG
ncbi:DUF4012 domain-containing protein [Cellulomonas marina]|uniref:DUF4012 domain-containing protein n=1 Tax=Cellulomonas marina TaxID=988821 RepID=A0A1I1ASK7_9CELL|nr:DUF4012 domain-containing protein [Cellulomonas marina]GIG30427.1 hypothetical protein Cma02nite_30270 [Cellulomonas marina]SFB39303.1 Protein of unknown function [Cellulomonas marina]